MNAVRRAARIPVCTYRLQFNQHFTFRDARAIVDYLHALGVSDCYASSYLRAVPGSGHGYDVADPTRLNPEIGSDEDYWAWVHALQSRGMGHVLDLVPNHMGIAKSANPWWMDVLENGPSSRYARFFDIEWQPVKDELADKLLIPILGDFYGIALEQQQLQLSYRDGSFVVEHYDNWLPIAADTYSQIIRAGFDALPDLAGMLSEDASTELQSIATAADNLPSRSSRDAEAIALRAREKEVVKRRLAAVVEGHGAGRALIDGALRHLNGVSGQPRTFDRLDRLLNQQSYRLAFWRVASEEINYRRFFDVNQLAALRMEDEEVFDEVHRFAFELIARGAATGLRVDHVDGLFAPADYLRRLQTRAAAALDVQANPAERPLYLVVEKILGADEALPPEWPVHGTTGYEFAFVVNNLFVAGPNEKAFDDLYRRFIREPFAFEDLAYRSKKTVMHETMSGDINSLGHQLNRFSEHHRHFRDFTLYDLISTLKEIIACFPVYRTYVTGTDPVSEHDRRYIHRAIRCAKRRAPGIAAVVFDFVAKLLLKQTPPDSDHSEETVRFIGKFQQITSPVAAKGIEDTALYAYNRLVSLNEVGGDPTRFGFDAPFVHQWLADRRRQWPFALSATSTHDTKRGEDVRARLDVLSELPQPWKTAVTKWRALNRRFKSEVNGVAAPDANEEYLIYQTLVGAWPFDAAATPPFAERLAAYLTKALREAKVNTSWLNPDADHEAAVLRFAAAILDRRRPFMAAFLPFQSRIAELGIYNSLAQLLIKITAPGVPDFYQGTELWDLSLVDPDNRRPVDYGVRQDLLRTAAAGPTAELAAGLLDSRADGRVKLFTMVHALRARQAMRAVFEEGCYIPLPAVGVNADHLFAFARRHDDQLTITCVPRLVASLVGGRQAPPVGGEVWGDTTLTLPPSSRVRRFRNAFTGATVTASGDDEATLRAADLFQLFPVALLVGDPA